MTRPRSLADAPVEHVVSALRERLYGGISCLATLAVLSRYTSHETSAWARLLDLAVSTGGLWAASLLADGVSHMAVYGKAPRGRALLHLLQTSSQILQASVIPMGLFVAAGLGLLGTQLAQWIAIWVVVGELGLFALFAVRRTHLEWWRRLVAVAALLGLGAVVVAVKTFAH